MRNGRGGKTRSRQGTSPTRYHLRQAGRKMRRPAEDLSTGRASTKRGNSPVAGAYCCFWLDEPPEVPEDPLEPPLDEPPLEDFSPVCPRPLVPPELPELLLVLVPVLPDVLVPVLALDLVLVPVLVLDLVPTLVLVEPRTVVSPRERTEVRLPSRSSTPTPTRRPCRISTLPLSLQRHNRTRSVVSRASVAVRAPAGEVLVMALTPTVPNRLTARPAAVAKMKARMHFLHRFGNLPRYQRGRRVQCSSPVSAGTRQSLTSAVR